MDGASRFTQRDAVASILITGINIIAGFLIGVLQHGMDLRQALETYTVLTIGDGLVTVIPALMISISGGLIVTRASSDARLGAEFQKQIFGNSQPLMLASGVLVALAAASRACRRFRSCCWAAELGYGGWQMRDRKSRGRPQPTAEAKPAAAKENLESLLRVEPLAIEVGLGLVGLVEGGQESPLLRRIAGIRRQLATDLGYLLPPVRVTDNLSLRSREYVISLKGVGDRALRTAAGLRTGHSRRASRDPPHRRAADARAGLRHERLVDFRRTRRAGAEFRLHGGRSAQRAGHASVRDDPPPCPRAVLAAGRQAAARPRGRGASEGRGDLVPKLLPLATVQRVLQNLLRERVSIRDAVSILEALGEAGRARAIRCC